MPEASTGLVEPRGWHRVSNLFQTAFRASNLRIVDEILPVLWPPMTQRPQGLEIRGGCVIMYTRSECLLGTFLNS